MKTVMPEEVNEEFENHKWINGGVVNILGIDNYMWKYGSVVVLFPDRPLAPSYAAKLKITAKRGKA
jgi:hypothetical protein